MRDPRLPHTEHDPATDCENSIKHGIAPKIEEAASPFVPRGIKTEFRLKWRIMAWEWRKRKFPRSTTLASASAISLSVEGRVSLRLCFQRQEFSRAWALYPH
jgi:hypothetical protein